MSLLHASDWAGVLASTDNVSQRLAYFDGSQEVTFLLPPGWNVGLGGKDDYAVTEASIQIDGDSLNLTKTAIERIAIEVGLTPRYIEKTPGPLIVGHLNYWAKHGAPDRPISLLVSKDTALSVVKKALTIFPNAEIFTKATDAMGEVEQWVDGSKSHNAYDLTMTRMVLPVFKRTFTTYRGEEEWWGGVQIANSLTGRTTTAIEGYVYSRVFGHGVITTHAAQHYNRRGGHTLADVLEWVPDAVTSVLDATAYELETIEGLVEKSTLDMSKVLADIFRTYKVPLKVRNPILDKVEEAGDDTYFAIMCAISETANMDWNDATVTALMQIAGMVAHDAVHRCPQCLQAIL